MLGQQRLGATASEYGILEKTAGIGKPSRVGQAVAPQVHDGGNDLARPRTVDAAAAKFRSQAGVGRVGLELA